MPIEIVRDIVNKGADDMECWAIPRQETFDLTVKLVDKAINRLTYWINLAAADQLGAAKPAAAATMPQAAVAQPATKSGDSGKKNQTVHAQQQRAGGSAGGGDGGGRVKLNPYQHCEACGSEHKHMYYCEEFIKGKIDDRFELLKAQQACPRCLYMGRRFRGPKISWWPFHVQYCNTDFACTEDSCGARPTERQVHFTVCRFHSQANQAKVDDFWKGLDQKDLPPGLSAADLQLL
jgi:hypothetical protein